MNAKPIRLKRPVFILSFAAASAALIALDQWTKVLAERFLAGRGVLEILGDYVILVFAQNTGAFLSLGAGLPEPARLALLVFFPSAMLVAALFFLCLKSEPSPRALAIACLLASGGFGNQIDRLFKGKVTDFLNFGVGNIRTGVMNLADLYILALLILLVLGMASERKKDISANAKAKEPNEGAPDGAQAPAEPEKRD
jgi:signal peptidase II